jgi:hypothetical protein
LAIKRTNFPKALYRYRSLERLAYTLEELRDGYIILSKPTDFNDPYDSALSISNEQLQKQILEKFAPGSGYNPNTQAKFFESLNDKEKEEWHAQQKSEQQSLEPLRHWPGAKNRVRREGVGSDHLFGNLLAATLAFAP